MHPMFNDIAPDLIAVRDQEAAHGNFRARAKSGRPGIGEDLPRWASSTLRTRRSA